MKKKDLQKRIFTLKLFQFIGGVIAIIVGTILVVLDVNDPARIDIGVSGLEVGISAISGVAVIIAGIILLYRSGGGIKTKEYVEKRNGLKIKDRIEYTVDAHRDYPGATKNSSLVCPECNHELDEDDIFLYCNCKNCNKEWKQRMPS